MSVVLIKLERDMFDGPKYSRSLSYSLEIGRETTLTVEGCETIQDANKSLAYFLVGSGYRYPKWYEWWRWLEKRPTIDLAIRIDDELARINAQG